MKIFYKILEILNHIFTLWLFYIAVKYLLIAKTGYTLFSLTLGVTALALFAWRIYKLLNSRKKEIDPEGYGYIPNMLKASKGLLLDDYRAFEKEVRSAVKENKPYIIGIDGTKYYTAYIEPDNHKEWNRRYIQMHKEKDIKITKRDGLDIQEVVTINHVGDDLERYMFIYARLKGRLLQFSADELVDSVKKLIAPYKIVLDFEKIEHIYQKYANSIERYNVDFCDSNEIWHIKDIEAFKEVANQLKEQEYLFLVAGYESDNRYFCLLDANTTLEMLELQIIDIRTVDAILTKNIKERFYTYFEKFEMLYEKIEPRIAQDEHENIYKIDLKNSFDNESFSYMGGKGIGVDDKSYPYYENQPMAHMCSFDTRDFPHLAKKYPDIRVISLYISSFNENYAFELDTAETKVLLLTQEEIESKKLTIDVPVGMEAKSMDITSYLIPKDLLLKSILEYPEESWQREIYSYWHNFSYVGGSPTWIQDGFGKGVDGFIGQIDEHLFLPKNGSCYSLANFGGGVMYIFDDLAFWECG